MNETTLSPPASVHRHDAPSLGRQMLNKVPEITIYFWVIKILCTTVGETAADLMNEELGLGLTNTTYIMSALLIAVLVAQFRARKYIPGVYWLAVVLISIVGTLITDNLVDNAGVPLMTTTIVFSAALALVFAVWYWSERTLSVHTIVTSKREAFYWLAILFTFALGTSAGDLFAEKLELGYLPSAGIFAGAIAVIAISHFRFKLNAILAFWLAYILTRPLGASIGDFLSQPVEETGLGLGTVTTSLIFLSAILALVVYLTVTKRDLIAVSSAEVRLGPQPDGETEGGEPRVLVITNKTDATPAVISAVRERAAAGPARFFVLVPDPQHLPFDRVAKDTSDSEQALARTLPQLGETTGAEVEGRVANSPNAYDDIVEELRRGDYREIILETVPSHVSHWLHVDLPERVAHLGYPVTTVTATT
ncbi:MAG: putative rane-anchored protein [Solirubrobacterales bacterium]|nr:putative rane-anchored protein [Solirubrobacterales bacterium]